MRPQLVPTTRSAGIALAAATAVISGAAVFVNGYGVRAWSDSGASTAVYTTVKNAAAALLLIGLLGVASARKRDAGFTRPSSRKQWLGLLAVGILGGSLPFLLFFEGLARADSAQAALLHKSLVVWVALLAVPLLGERLDTPHVWAIGLLVAGQIVLAGGVTDLGFGVGEAMILAATLLWSAEVIIAKRLLTDLSALTVGVARMGLGVMLLAGWAIGTGAIGQIGAVPGSEWGWIALTGFTLTAYVATWYGALARAQAVDVTAVLVFGAVITALLRTGVTGVALPSVAGLGLVTAGAALIIVAFARHAARGGTPAVR